MLFLGNHQAVLEEDNTSLIHGKTFSNSASDVFLNPGYALITLLGSYDLIRKVRLRHQGG